MESTPAEPTSTSPKTGRERAKVVGEALRELELRDTWVVSSPRRRAIQTAELAGLTIDEVSPLLAEWDYGDYEGLTTPEIRKSVRPTGWSGRTAAPAAKPSGRCASAPTRRSASRWTTWNRATWSSPDTVTSPARSSPGGSSCRWSEVAGSHGGRQIAALGYGYPACQ
jgi:broad specificity phosphatase PhoE